MCRCMEELRSTSMHALRTLRMPSLRNEAYRFCDVSPILSSNLQVCITGYAQPIDAGRIFSSNLAFSVLLLTSPDCPACELIPELHPLLS